MKVSYRRAWLLLQDIERIFGGKVLERHTGGKAGGGAALNQRGRDIVKHFAPPKSAPRAPSKQSWTRSSTEDRQLKIS